MVPSKIPALPNLKFLLLISMSLTMMQGCLWRNILPATVWTVRNHPISTEMSPSPRLRNRDNRKLGRSRGVPRWNIGCRNQNQGHRDPGSLAAAEALGGNAPATRQRRCGDSKDKQGLSWNYCHLPRSVAFRLSPGIRLSMIFPLQQDHKTLFIWNISADPGWCKGERVKDYRSLQMSVCATTTTTTTTTTTNSSKLIQTQPRPSTYLAGVKNACASVRFQLRNKIQESKNRSTQTPSFFGTALGPRFRMENLLDPLRPLRPLPGRSQPGQRRQPRQPWNVTEALRLAQHAGTSAQFRLGRCEMWSGATFLGGLWHVVRCCEMLWDVVTLEWRLFEEKMVKRGEMWWNVGWFRTRTHKKCKRSWSSINMKECMWENHLSECQSRCSKALISQLSPYSAMCSMATLPKALQTLMMLS